MNRIDDFLEYCDDMEIAEEMDKNSKIKLAAAGVAAVSTVANGVMIAKDIKERKALKADKAPLKEMENKYALKIKQAEAKIKAGRKSKNWSLAIAGCKEGTKIYQSMINETESIKNEYRRKASDSKAFVETCDRWIESFKEDIDNYTWMIEKFKFKAKKDSMAKESLTFFDIISNEVALETFFDNDIE